MFISPRSRITSMFAAVAGGSLLLVATPSGAFASDLEPSSPTANTENSAVSESSPAENTSPEQTTTDSLIDTFDAQALADEQALEAERAAQAAAAAEVAVAKAKAAAIAKKKAADARKPISIAKRYVGVRYKRGGTSPKTGFDCSGFTRYVFKKAGKSIPRTSSAQRYAGKTVSRAKAKPGDLVWFSDFHHVAIYAGNGYIIDAPKPGKKVTKRKLWTSHVKYIRVVA